MRTSKALVAVAAVLAVFGTCFLCVWPIWPYRTIGSFDLGDGCYLRIWSFDDWFDIDSRGPRLYYCVYHGPKAVHHQSFAGLFHDQNLHYKTAFAEGGQLACVYSEEHLRHADAFFVFDLRTEESWPRHMHENEDGHMIPKERWVERFQKLVQENPDIPRLRELTKWD